MRIGDLVRLSWFGTSFNDPPELKGVGVITDIEVSQDGDERYEVHWPNIGTRYHHERLLGLL